MHMVTEVNKSTEANKVSVRRFYDEVFNKKNRAAIDDFIAPNHVDHAAPPGTPGGIEGAKQTLTMYLTAFPDLHFTVEDIIAEGDKVVARLTARGTQARNGHPGPVATTRRASCTRTIGIRPDNHKGSLHDSTSMRQRVRPLWFFDGSNRRRPHCSVLG